MLINPSRVSPLHGARQLADTMLATNLLIFFEVTWVIDMLKTSLMKHCFFLQMADTMSSLDPAAIQELWPVDAMLKAITLTWLVDLSQKSLLTLNSHGQLLLNDDVPIAIVFIISILQIFSWE